MIHNTATLLELRGISKSFAGVRALEGVDFGLREGEVHGLVGENGAGKSTLMKILSGVHASFGGTMLLRGEPVRFSSPRAAKDHGVGMIYQELSSVPALSVAENLCLGDHPRNRMGLVDWKEMLRRGRSHLATLGIEIDVRMAVEKLSLGLQQLVEVARVTHSGADILIMDEPTSALSATEVTRLFDIIETLKRQNKSVIFVSHVLEDVLQICDRITVLRDGRRVDTLESRGTTKGAIVHHMLGDHAKKIEESYEKDFVLKSDPSSKVVLRARGLERKRHLEGVDFDVREGEVLGLFGMMGAGHSTIGRCLYGLERCDAGDLTLDGKHLTPRSCHAAKARGIAYVSPDRTASLFLDAKLYKNITVAFLKQTVSFPLRKIVELGIADRMVKRLRVKTVSSEVALRTLSGGNQQKVALARWLVHPIRLLVLDEPTRGMDVGAKEEVMSLVRELRNEGMGIVLISCEPETIMLNCDRILVLSKGRVSGEFENETVSKAKLLRCT